MKNVTAALYLKGGKILIAKRMLGQHLGEKWEFPGGKVEPGETPEECLARELKEEFGIEAKIGVFFNESIYHYDKGSIRLLGYFVNDSFGDFVPTVHEEIRWVDLNDLTSYDLAPADIPLAESLVFQLQFK